MMYVSHAAVGDAVANLSLESLLTALLLLVKNIMRGLGNTSSHGRILGITISRALSNLRVRMHLSIIMQLRTASIAINWLIWRVKATKSIFIWNNGFNI